MSSIKNMEQSREIRPPFLLRFKAMSGLIQNHSSTYSELAQAFRREIVDTDNPPSGVGADGKYSDLGYNRKPGTHCENSSHVVAF